MSVTKVLNTTSFTIEVESGTDSKWFDLGNKGMPIF